MNVVVGVVGVAFLVFVVVMALKGRRARKDLTDEVCEDIDFIYEQTQKRHAKRRGHRSDELSAARRGHVKAFDGGVRASK